MAIWGWKRLSRSVSSGVFACPEEETERAYWVYRDRTWFTLFSIPLIPSNAVEDHVECFCCGMRYDSKILALNTTSRT